MISRSSLKLDLTTKIGKEELRRIRIILTSLIESNDSCDFREPVDWKGMGLTDYPSIIKHPMDLSTVYKKLKDEKYDHVEGALDDLQLIWDNCKSYNPENSWIHSLAEKLERSFRKMVRNYFHDLNVTIPITAKLEGLQDPRGPASIFEEDNEDITYHEKLKFSEQLSFLSSNQLEKVIDEIIKSCPKAYRDMPEGKGQILVDNMDLIFFSEISLAVRQMLEYNSMVAETVDKHFYKKISR